MNADARNRAFHAAMHAAALLWLDEHAAEIQAINGRQADPAREFVLAAEREFNATLTWMRSA